MIKRRFYVKLLVLVVLSLEKMRKCTIYSDFNKKYNFCENKFNKMPLFSCNMLPQICAPFADMR